MDIYTSIFELIDMRSFSNLWFWIGLAVMWSSTSHWVLGVPFDIIQRARNQIQQNATHQTQEDDLPTPQAVTDLEDLVRINIRRLTHISRTAAIWMFGFVFFLITSTFLLGFFYKAEFSQAVFFLIFPFSIVIMMSIDLAVKIDRDQPKGIALIDLLVRLRFHTQLIGMFSILVTSMWGMYQNISANVLGI